MFDMCLTRSVLHQKPKLSTLSRSPLRWHAASRCKHLMEQAPQHNFQTISSCTPSPQSDNAQPPPGRFLFLPSHEVGHTLGGAHPWLQPYPFTTQCFLCEILFSLLVPSLSPSFSRALLPSKAPTQPSHPLTGAPLPAFSTMPNPPPRISIPVMRWGTPLA